MLRNIIVHCIRECVCVRACVHVCLRDFIFIFKDRNIENASIPWSKHWIIYTIWKGYMYAHKCNDVDFKRTYLFYDVCTVAEKYTHLLAFQISCSPSRKTCSPENFTCSLENFTCSPENFTCSPENFTCSPQHFTSSPVKCSYWPAQFNFPCAHLKLMAVQT